MEYETIFLGKTKVNFLTEGIKEYDKRLSRYAKHSIRLVKEKKNSSLSVDARKLQEGRLLLDQIQEGSYIVALDFRGKQLTSEGLAEKINQLEMQNVRKVCFLIGGPDGLSDEVRNNADMLLSFSKMTFTHDMIRLFLLEQLYRAYTIKAGEKYHK